MQNRTFDPGGSQGRLRACPIFTWRALLCGEVVRVGAAGDELQCFLEKICWPFEERPALMLCQKQSRRRKRPEATDERRSGHRWWLEVIGS